MARSAWGLSSPSDLPWQTRARCAEPDVASDLFTTDTKSAVGLALHICHAHCPVLGECRADAQANPPRGGGVFGGLSWLNVGARADTAPRLRVDQEIATRCGLCFGQVVPVPVPIRVSIVRCGTRSGSRRHRERGESSCPDCLAAEREYKRQRRARAREEAQSA